MRPWWLALAVVATPVVAQDAGSGDIYGTALSNGWENRSTATVELSTEIQGSQRKPIWVEAGPYQALSLYHAPFDTTPYKSMAMLIQGMDGGAQQLRIVAVVDGRPLEAQAYPVTLPASGWKKVELPLAKIGADKKRIDGLLVQNATDKAIAPFVVTEIALH